MLDRPTRAAATVAGTVCTLVGLFSGTPSLTVLGVCLIVGGIALEMVFGGGRD